MDETRMVRDLYAAPAPAAEHEVVAARARLDAMTRRRPRARRPGLRWALPGVGLAAAVTAVAVAVATSGGSPRPTAPPGGPSARTVLLDAALLADRQPATSGKYWHVDSQIRWLQKVRAGGYLIADTSRSESWQVADRTGRAISRVQYLGARPARPTDRAAWRKAGSPHAFLTVEGKRTTTSPERLITARGAPAEILQGMGAAAQAGLDRLREAPADPVRLRAWLLALPDSPTRLRPIPKAKLRGVKPGVPMPSMPPPPSKAQVDHWLFVQGADLILYSPVTPQVRAAAFRMLAALPGVKLVGTVRDADGRKGTAVAMNEIDPGDKPEQLQQRLVIDPADGGTLAYEEVVLGTNIIYPSLPAGTIASTTTVRTAGWTEKSPA
jgi:hypothetical protein